MIAKMQKGGKGTPVAGFGTVIAGFGTVIALTVLSVNYLGDGA